MKALRMRFRMLGWQMHCRPELAVPMPPNEPTAYSVATWIFAAWAMLLPTGTLAGGSPASKRRMEML